MEKGCDKLVLQLYNSLGQHTQIFEIKITSLTCQAYRWAKKNVQTKVIHLKNYKRYAYALAHDMSFIAVAYFDIKKYTLKKPKLAVFLITAMYRNYNFVFVLPMKIWKKHLKLGCFSNVGEIFRTALTTQIAQKQQKYKINLNFIVLGIYNFAYIMATTSGSFYLLHFLCWYKYDKNVGFKSTKQKLTISYTPCYTVRAENWPQKISKSKIFAANWALIIGNMKFNGL